MSLSCFWQSENEDTVIVFRAKISLAPWWRAENDISVQWSNLSVVGNTCTE